VARGACYSPLVRCTVGCHTLPAGRAPARGTCTRCTGQSRRA
jgi:hypothetical protein